MWAAGAPSGLVHTPSVSFAVDTDKFAIGTCDPSGIGNKMSRSSFNAFAAYFQFPVRVFQSYEIKCEKH